jgi:DNA-binding NtrC family response regulator
MSKKHREPESLGEVTAGLRTSTENLLRLASPHPSVRHVIEVVGRLQVRPYITNAVIGGEPLLAGAGLAHTLHELMHPDGAPLVLVATAGRAEAELAGELFGRAPAHKGERPSDGAVGDADGGTLVLEDAAQISPSLQRRLLGLVKGGRYVREGDTRERRAQLSVFAIVDGNLRDEVKAGRFRHDLYHKLARLDLVLPPLRERPEDVPAATAWMAKRILAARGLPAHVHLEADAPPTANGVIVRRAAIDALRQERWPGNFRELEIVVERALMLYGDGAQITATDVARALADPRG